MRKNSLFKRTVAIALAGTLVFGNLVSAVATPTTIEEFTKPDGTNIIVPEPLYLYNFESELASTGSETNADATIVGGGSIVNDVKQDNDVEAETYRNNKVFNNAAGIATTLRENYLSLPSSVGSKISSVESKAVTIAMWIKSPSANTDVEAFDFHSPLFAMKTIADNGFYPCVNVALKGSSQVNCNGWVDNNKNMDPSYIEDHKWHYVVATFSSNGSTVYVDGMITNHTDNTTDNTCMGMFGSTDFNSVSIGGNNIWTWNDKDAHLYFDDIAIYDQALTKDQITAIMEKTAVTSKPLIKDVSLTSTAANTVKVDYTPIVTDASISAKLYTNEGTETAAIADVSTASSFENVETGTYYAVVTASKTGYANQNLATAEVTINANGLNTTALLKESPTVESAMIDGKLTAKVSYENLFNVDSMEVSLTPANGTATILSDLTVDKTQGKHTINIPIEKFNLDVATTITLKASKAGYTDTSVTTSFTRQWTAVTALNVTASRTTVAPGSKITLTPSVSPDNATVKTVTYSLDNDNVATIEDNVLSIKDTAEDGTLIVTVSADGILEGAESITKNIVITIDSKAPIAKFTFDEGSLKSTNDYYSLTLEGAAVNEGVLNLATTSSQQTTGVALPAKLFSENSFVNGFTMSTKLQITGWDNDWSRILMLGDTGSDTTAKLFANITSGFTARIKASGLSETGNYGNVSSVPFDFFSNEENQNKWYTYTVTIDKNTIKIYLNGTCVNTYTAKDTEDLSLFLQQLNTAVNSYIGKSYWAADYDLQGKMDNISFYNYALDISDVTDICVENGESVLFLDKSEVSIIRDSSNTTTANLTATVKSNTITDKTVTWASSDDTIATVDNTGKITAVSDGTATITASCGDLTATCKVIISTIKATDIKLDKETATIKKGETTTITATTTPNNAFGNITWNSGNTAVATVTDGVITAVGGGTTDITASIGDVTATCTVTVSVPLTGFTLSSNTLALENAKIGDTVTKDNATLNVAFIPEDTTDDKTIIWHSNDESIAIVDNKGIVTAVAETGTTTITATVGTFTKECTVTITTRDLGADAVLATGITLDKNTAEVEVNKTVQLTATITPSNVSINKCDWTSSDDTVATVDTNGLVTALKAGTVTITAATKDGTNKSAACTVTVTAAKVAVTGVTLDKNTLSLEENASQKLTATVAPANATVKDVTWTSDTPSVATVDENGNVKAIAAGTAKIKVTSKDNAAISATCNVTVTAAVIEKSVALASDSKAVTLEEGKSQTLKATVSPSGAALKWTVENPKVATVDDNGKVTAVAEGTTKITVSLKDDASKSDVCNVTVTAKKNNNNGGTTTVKPAKPTLTLSKTSVTLYTGKASNSITIKPTVTGASKAVKWVSKNTKIAKVVNGKITAVKAGKTTVTATANGISKIVSVTVKNPSFTIKQGKKKFTKSKLTVKKKKSVKLTVSVTPAKSGISLSGLSKKSKKIASVKLKSGKLTIKGKKKGKLTITLKSGKATKKIKVTVK